MILLFTLLAIPILSFVPSVFNYNTYDMPLDNTASLACTLDFNKCTGIIGNSLRLFQKQSTGYCMVTQVHAVCDPGLNCLLDRNYLKKDGTVAMVYSNTDGKYKIYQIINNTFSFVQTITFISPISRLQPFGDNYIFLGNFTTLLMYEYDTMTGQYTLNYTYTFSANSHIYSFSEDAKIIVQIYLVPAATDFTITIHQLDAATGLYTTTILPLGFPAGPSKTVRDISMTIINGVYVLLAVFYDTGSFYLKYYQITSGSSFLLQQTLNTGGASLNFQYLTRNGLFLVVEASSSLFYFQYDSVTDQYVRIYNLTAFRAQPVYPITAENGTMMMVAQMHSTLYQVVLLFTCEVQYCSSCQFIGVCATCLHGYTLNNGACGCGINQTMLGSSCISCAVSNCGSCGSPNVCVNCTNGYTLGSFNTCQCQVGNTISGVDGSCVSCNVQGCYRCDQTDLCASFYQSLSNSNPQINDNRELWIVVIILLVVVGFLIAGLVAVIVKLATTKQVLKKVSHETTFPDEQINANKSQNNVSSLTSMDIDAEIEKVEAMNKQKEVSRVEKTVKRRRMRQDNFADLDMEL